MCAAYVRCRRSPLLSWAGERFLVIDHQGDEHIILIDGALDFRIGEHGGFHLAAVHAAEAGEVDKDWFIEFGSEFHAFLITVDLSVDVTFIEVEVLGIDRRSESGDVLERSSPEARNHVYCESEGDQGQREACQTDFLHFVVVRKSEFAEEVEAEECEDHDPERYEHLAVEDTPSVSKVGDGEELEGKSQLEESGAPP